MVELLEGTRKPKVVRMSLAYFCNLVTVPETDAEKHRNCTALVGLNMLNILRTVCARPHLPVPYGMRVSTYFSEF